MSKFIFAILLFWGAIAAHAANDDPGTQFFESKIRPLFVEKCYACHSSQAKKLKGGLYLDNREKAYKGGESGLAFIPGHPEKSRLIEAIGYKNVDLQMPPKDRLSDTQIADLTAWIKMGAPWGIDAAAPVATKVEAFDLQKRKAEHWVWKPVLAPPIPAVKNQSWPKSDIDRFILAALEEKNLSPAPQADRRALLRRLYFDLTGLSPNPEEIEEFLTDTSPQSLEKITDRLLASPQFGERWARHWMDLTRYAETLGHEFDFPIANAWHYRDYIIRAFNADLPYNQLILEHVAGDLLASPRRMPDGNNESIIASGFWFFTEGAQSPVDVKQAQADAFDNKIDILGKTFMGVTVACARCHDHKFDAISTADYYALYGYVKGTRYTQYPINDQAINAAAQNLKPLHEKLRQAIANHWLTRIDTITAKEIPLPTDAPLRATDTDLAANNLADWRADSSAFTPAQPGDFVLGDEKHPLTILTGTGQTSAALSRKLEGSLRSPNFTIDKRYLHVCAQGQGARLSIIIENFSIIRDPIYGTLKQSIHSDKPAWITVDLKMWQGRQAYLEFSDITVADPGGPNSPDTAWLTVDRALVSDDARPPTTPDQPVPLAQYLRESIELWRDNKLAESADASTRATLLNHLAQKGLLDITDPSITSLIKEYHRAEQSIPAPEFAVAAADGTNVGNENIFIRGNYKNPGPTVPRRLLEALSLSTHDSALSTRFDLANHIADPQNPLTTRVYVNRIWHHLLGRGIVASVDNFGKMGEPPSNPALLDYLADRFVKEGWSTKKLIREIVLSSVYQMSSKSDEQADQLDPENKLFHRANIRRLEAEAIRDHLLQVSGRLDLAMYGPGVPVHLTPFMEGRGRPGSSGPLDGAGRRSIYIEVRRNFLPPMLLTFDFPIPFNTMGKRTSSNVPAQALILMNDPFVQDQAKLWAKRTLAQKDATPEQRIQQMYEQAFSRPPTKEETTAILAFANEQAEEYGVPKNTLNDARIWTDIAHALINTKEFIFIE